MKVKIGTPLTEYAVAAGDIVLTSSRQVLIATANVNDYHYVCVDLSRAEVIDMLTDLAPMSSIGGELIVKVVHGDEAELKLP